MMLSCRQKFTLFTLILLITGCSMFSKKNNQHFTWEAKKSGPKGFPVEILRGKLYFKEENDGLPIPSGPSDGKWGEGFANHPEVTHNLPDRLEVTFYSYAENQAYHGMFDLPYDTLVEQFQWGVDNPFKRLKHSQPQFSRFVVAIAPGGTVGLWIAGPGEQREVIIAQAEKLEMSLSSVFQVPFGSAEEAEEFRVRVLKKDVGDEQFQDIQQNGVPFDIWQRYRKPYQWIVDSGSTTKFTDLYLTQINGERSSVLFDYSQINTLTAPSFIRFYHGPKLYILNLDDYETIAAFERLDAIEGLKPEERLIHIEVTAKLPKETSTVRLYNAKGSIVLKKAIFKP